MKPIKITIKKKIWQVDVDKFIEYGDMIFLKKNSPEIMGKLKMEWLPEMNSFLDHYLSVMGMPQEGEKSAPGVYAEISGKGWYFIPMDCIKKIRRIEE